MTKKILTLPNKILRSKSEKITKNDDSKNLATLMSEVIESYTTKHEAGIALAAVQIGIPKRMIVIKQEDEYIALINPVIIKFSKKKENDLEGCMSIPQKYGMVSRPKTIKIKAKSINGDEIKITAEGTMARIIQHEIDHLNGILFIDYITDQSKIYTLDRNGNLIKANGTTNET